MKIKPVYQITRGKETAQALVEEYKTIGRKAEARGRFVVLYPMEYIPKRRRDDD